MGVYGESPALVLLDASAADLHALHGTVSHDGHGGVGVGDDAVQSDVAAARCWLDCPALLSVLALSWTLIAVLNYLIPLMVYVDGLYKTDAAAVTARLNGIAPWDRVLLRIAELVEAALGLVGYVLEQVQEGSARWSPGRPREISLALAGYMSS